MGAFNTVFDAGNLHRPTDLDDVRDDLLERGRERRVAGPQPARHQVQLTFRRVGPCRAAAAVTAAAAIAAAASHNYQYSGDASPALEAVYP
jgi:hypothetical protein